MNNTTKIKPPVAGQYFFNPARGRVYGKIQTARADGTYTWISFSSGCVIDTLQHEGVVDSRSGRIIGRSARTWEDAYGRGARWSFELPAPLVEPPDEEKAKFYFAHATGAVWADEDFKPDGKGRCICPRCGKSISTNGLARASHKRSKACKAAGPRPESWGPEEKE